MGAGKFYLIYASIPPPPAAATTAACFFVFLIFVFAFVFLSIVPVFTFLEAAALPEDQCNVWPLQSVSYCA